MVLDRYCISRKAPQALPRDFIDDVQIEFQSSKPSTVLQGISFIKGRIYVTPITRNYLEKANNRFKRVL